LQIASVDFVYLKDDWVKATSACEEHQDHRQPQLHVRTWDPQSADSSAKGGQPQRITAGVCTVEQNVSDG